eukprot:Selendium_serpulae@DN11483_c0_g1_i1.p1
MAQSSTQIAVSSGAQGVGSPSSSLGAVVPAGTNGTDSGTVDVTEFYVKNFSKIAKNQTDIESTEIGRCRGFHYRLLIHPRGTAGTDSESSHLSLFLEAVRQDWYPDDWVFPNVRFELTVHNFKDPKQSVTSWAHWSFSNDATSRGWQKMLSHSSLTKKQGFVDQDGAVLIKGKAEPPYPCLWSRTPRYRPVQFWELMPPAATSKSAGSPDTPTGPLPPAHPAQQMLQMCDSLVPALRTTLHADYLSCFIQILYHIKEFRREVFLWNTALTS